MVTAAQINRLIIDKLSFNGLARLQNQTSREGFYQEMLLPLIKDGNIKNFLLRAANKLVALAEQAYVFRQIDPLISASQLLIHLPLDQHYLSIGQYYHALSLQKTGEHNLDRALTLLDRVAAKAPPAFRIRALQSLGGNFYYKGSYQLALSFYGEAGRFASANKLYDPYALVGTQKMIAVIKSIEGDHKKALRLLEQMLPLAHKMRRIHPQVYFDYLNSLAVELGEAGRLEQARNVCRIVLESPYACAYPEWRETGKELEIRAEPARRSKVVGVNQSARSDSKAVSNVVAMPAREMYGGNLSAVREEAGKRRRARVYSYLEWKKNNMVKESEEGGETKAARQKLTQKQMMMRILSLISDENLSEQEMAEILCSVEDVIYKKKLES
jgi:hypothetical protein